MQRQDKINIAISIAALFISIGAAISGKVDAISMANKQERRNIYDAYQLGQAVAVVYVYAKSNKEGEPVEGETLQGIADEQIGHWSAAAQGYSVSFNIAPAFLIPFLAKIKTANATSLDATVRELDASIEEAAGTKAVLAYDVACQIIIFGTGTRDLSDYPTIRDLVNKELEGIGLNYALPTTVADHAAFTDAIKELKEHVDALRP
jgi:hypothetical protein